MIVLLWLVASLLSLLATVFLAAATVAAVRAKQNGALATSLAVSVVFLALLIGVHQPVVAALVALAAGFVGRTLLRRCTPNAQRALQATKLSAAHLTLLCGSFLFLIPFAWLISTSLKPDDEQAAFPPVWIPTQQITLPDITRPDGMPAGVSDYKPKEGKEPKDNAPAATAAPVRVAEVADLPNGDIRIRVLPPATNAGKEMTASREELTKIRQVSPRWQNYSEALAYLPPETLHGLRFLGNTLLLTLLSALGTVLSSSLVAYAFARLNWPGRNLWFGVLLATMMIPGAVTMMPQFLIFRSLGWYDTLRPLWVPAFFGSAFNVFLLRQFFLSIPSELEDAAKIDGCGPFAVYWRVMLPLVKPALAAIAIMSVLGSWNNFQGPLIYLSSPERMPLAYALQLYQTAHSGEPGLLMAASTLVVFPIIVLFFFTQRYFIEGVSLTGLGGR